MIDIKRENTNIPNLYIDSRNTTDVIKTISKYVKNISSNEKYHSVNYYCNKVALVVHLIDRATIIEELIKLKKEIPFIGLWTKPGDICEDCSLMIYIYSQTERFPDVTVDTIIYSKPELVERFRNSFKNNVFIVVANFDSKYFDKYSQSAFGDLFINYPYFKDELVRNYRKFKEYYVLENYNGIYNCRNFRYITFYPHEEVIEDIKVLLEFVGHTPETIEKITREILDAVDEYKFPLDGNFDAISNDRDNDIEEILKKNRNTRKDNIETATDEEDIYNIDREIYETIKGADPIS